MQEGLRFRPDRLREAITKAGVSQSQLARDAGLKLRSVQLWLAGGATPSAEALIRLSEYLDRHPAWFMGRDAPTVGNGEDC